MKKHFSFLLLILLFFSGCNIEQPAQDVYMNLPEAPFKSVSFVAVGDNLIHSYIYQIASQHANGNGFHFLPIYKRVASIISDADLAFLNQETPLGGTELELSGYPKFNSPKELAHDMAALGFDIINHATNHILDRGEQGIKNTLDALKPYSDVLVVGAYDSIERMNMIHTIKRNNITFAVLAYTYGTNGLTLPNNSTYKVASIDESLILRQVEEANKIADVVLVSMHWGAEDSMQVENWQRLLAQKIADKGGDILIGHHPHVLRPIEWVQREDGSRMLCAYSLGNFISTQKSKNNLLGGILSCNIVIASNGDVTVTNVGFKPTIAYYNAKRTDIQIVPLDEFTTEMAQNHGAAKENGGLSTKYFHNLASTILRTQ